MRRAGRMRRTKAAVNAVVAHVRDYREIQRRFPSNPVGFLLESEVHAMGKAKEQPETPVLLNNPGWVMAEKKVPKAIELSMLGGRFSKSREVAELLRGMP
ncbi:MAG: hypothetical protein LBJ46_12000 [Planctomycetota bacterium]|nr:hypothetical protein [Planctomycetota bacterium]